MGADARFGLIVPGLLPGLTEQHRQVGLPAAPTLERILARARRCPFAGWAAEELILALFGFRCDDPPPPIAALSWLGDGGQPGDQWVVRADPVHLHADLDRVRLFAGERVLRLRPEESAALCAAVNRHFCDRRWHLEPLHAQRWYLKLAHDPALVCAPLYRVAGGDLRAGMPSGPRGGYWRAVLNELQMLLCALPINEQRERRGELPVNGLWLWGAGRLAMRDPVPWAACCGENPVLGGLARVHGLSYTPQVRGALAAVRRGASGRLVALPPIAAPTTASDFDQWCTAVTSVDCDWLGPLVQRLRAGDIGCLELYPGDGSRYRVDRRALRRFWRRPRPLLDHCLAVAA